MFDLEKKYFDAAYALPRSYWIRDHWYLSIFFVVAYVITIFSLQHFMKNRKRLTLQTPLIIWNVMLSIFSIVGTVRFVPYLYHVVSRHGLEYSICNELVFYGVLACWGWQFALSKVAELVDTIFVVLRKQKLIFLHWYHHTTVLMFTWYSLSNLTATAVWFSGMNYTVHALMYSYYALRAMKVKVPKWVNIVITSLQISQMIWGIFLNLSVYTAKNSGRSCNVTYQNLYAAAFMYFTYFLLFFNFFYKVYLKNSRASAKKDE